MSMAVFGEAPDVLAAAGMTDANLRAEHRPSCCQFIYDGFPCPRQQLIDPVDRMIGNAYEDVAQVGFRVEPVELGSFDHRVHLGGTNTAAVRTREEIIFSAQDQ